MKSTKIAVNDDDHNEDSILQRMVTNEQQQDAVLNMNVRNHRLNTTSWLSRTLNTVQMKVFFTILLIVVIGCGSLLVLISNRTTQTDNSIITQEQDDSTELRDWNEEKENLMNNQISEDEMPQQFNTLNNYDNNKHINDNLPRLRSYVEREKPYPPERIGHMNIFIRDEGNRGSRSSYERLRFPVARYNRRRMPFGGPLTYFMPWIPIFADRLTKQTIIFSPIGVYIIPPVINMYGQMFSIAELIASGYASLVSSGIAPSGPIDMARFFQPTPLIGPTIPIINPVLGGFKGGIRTNSGSFPTSRRYEAQPDNSYRYNSEEEKDQYEDNYRPALKPPKNYKKLPKKYTTAAQTTTSKVSYFQASSSKNQLGGPTATEVTYNHIDGLNGFSVDSNGAFAYKSAGTYFAVYAAQIGSPNRNGEGNVHIWVRPSNQDKSSSTSIQTVKRGTTSVLISQTVFQVPVGQVASLAFSAIIDNECTSLGFIVTSPEKEPVVPSIISSTIQLSDANSPIVYAKLTSSETQLGDSTPKVITLNTISGNNGIGTTTTGANGAITYNGAGLYFAIASAQVGSSTNSNDMGEVHLWMRLNGIDIANSNTIQSVRNSNTAVLTSQTVFTLAANDKLELMFSSTNNKLGVIASKPTNEPAVPSMTFSTFQLDTKDKSVSYAQLSSSETQWGCLTPKGVHLDMDDGSKDVTNNNGILEFQQAGTYFLMAAAQVGSDNDQGIGDVHLWMKLNGEDMANSNTIQTINGDTAVLICQTIAEIKIDDKLQLIFSTDVTQGKLGLVATKPVNQPLVPSMIFSAFKSSF